MNSWISRLLFAWTPPFIIFNSGTGNWKFLEFDNYKLQISKKKIVDNLKIIEEFVPNIKELIVKHAQEKFEEHT